MRVFTSADDILASVGDELGTSDWLTITQERVDAFADATGDHQWIHVDVSRARTDSPYGGTIAHGYLTLSLVPLLASQTFRVENTRFAVNYGSNRVRFPAAVLVGSYIALTSVLSEAVERPGGVIQMVVEHTITVRDAAKPSLVAETISRVAF